MRSCAVRHYEFTAFRESDLLDANDNNLGVCDTFTMPESASVCITVEDNDRYLSGDNRRNENANDRSYQTATIEGDDGELGNGGQIYAESYYWVQDQYGEWYVMIEIEQEGTCDDYFTFYTGSCYSVPPAGAELTIYSCCNVKGKWLDFNCLDGGEKEPPIVAIDDTAKGCADEIITVDVLQNDPDGDTYTVTQINGIDISDNGPAVEIEVEVSPGVFGTLNVKLVNGVLEIDGEDAFAFLDIGEQSTASLSYTVTNGSQETTANLEVTFCGDANSVASLQANFPASAEYQVIYGLDETPIGDYGLDVKIVDADDDRFDGAVFEQVYCLFFEGSIATTDAFGSGIVNTAEIYGSQTSGASDDAFLDQQVSFFNGLAAGDNLDLINYIIAQDYENDPSGQYNAWEVQFAIWELTDNFDSSLAFGATPEFGDYADTLAILADAAANGEGFEAGVGDMVGMIVDPGTGNPDNEQPLILAVDFEQWDCLC